MDPTADSLKDKRAASARLADIPVRTVSATPAASACEEGGVFALQVIGDAMAPEFEHGDIIVAEVDGHIADGAFVVARTGEEWVLRQLVQRKSQGSSMESWHLVALDQSLPAEMIKDFSCVRGVVIQKSKPGRRRSIKRYV